jgi:arylsulfatase A-like enzyme
MVNKKNTFLPLVRIIFVIFSLYLMGDAFYRWDGFSYYASLHEFLPTVALAFILWSLVAGLAAILLWLLFKILNSAFRILGLKIGFEHILLYIGVFILFGTLAWNGKKIIWPYEKTALQVKLIVLVFVAFLSALLIWGGRDKAKRWADIVLERITPLVWLFGMMVILAVPLVAYHTWFEGANKVESKKITRDISVDKNRPNIILITFDGLAARNMSVYGYGRETTPFISKWSENATVFTMAEASSNFTTPSAASLMTGKRVWTHQTYQIEGTKPVRSNIESLPSVLKDNGYFNIAFVVNPFASIRVLGMSNSFDIAPLTSEFGKSASLFGWKFGTIDVMLYRAFGDKIRLHNWILKNDFIFSKFLNLISRNINQTEVPPEKAFNKFLEIMDNNIPKPFFAWIHVFPPHDPYLPPEPFIGKFNNSMELRTYKKQEQLVEESYKYLFQYQRVPEEMKPSINLMRDYYDEYVRYTDKEFEDFIQGLIKRKIEHTIIMLTADHGESFEHGYLTHGGPFLYEQVTHVPLIIKEAGQTGQQLVTDRVEQIDIPATILELANISAPSWMEGRSLIPLLRGDKLSPKPAFSMNFEENPSRGHRIIRGSIAVWEGDYKLIHYLQRNESLLFNIKKDPGEIENLIDREPEARQRLLDLIRTNLDSANQKNGNSK